MGYRVSVIVTVHNAEHTLRRCMDSLMAQKFPEMEILCIDGGSTDENIAILESDDRMKENMIETLYGYAETYQADYVDADYEAVCQVETAYVKIPIQKYGSGGCYEKVIPYEERGKLLLCATGAIWTSDMDV